MRLALQQNPFVYPAGVTPGFDPTHIANRSGWVPLYSAVASAGGAINLLNGSKGTITNAPTSSIQGIIGPATKFTHTTDSIGYAAPTTQFKGVIAAAIVMTPATLTSYPTMVTTSSSNAGWRLGWDQDFVAVALTAGGVAAKNSSLTLAVNTPYFIAASADTVTANFVVANLATGAIRTATTAGATANAGNGTALFGGYSTFGWPGAVACAMAAGSAAATGLLSLQELRAWAENPWAYWYPQSDDRALQEWVGVAAASVRTRYYYDMARAA